MKELSLLKKKKSIEIESLNYGYDFKSFETVCNECLMNILYKLLNKIGPLQEENPEVINESIHKLYKNLTIKKANYNKNLKLVYLKDALCVYKDEKGFYHSINYRHNIDGHYIDANGNKIPFHGRVKQPLKPIGHPFAIPILIKYTGLVHITPNNLEISVVTDDQLNSFCPKEFVKADAHNVDFEESHNLLFVQQDNNLIELLEPGMYIELKNTITNEFLSGWLHFSNYKIIIKDYISKRELTDLENWQVIFTSEPRTPVTLVMG